MRWNPVLAVLSFLAACALGLLPFVRVAPNRLVSGEPVPWWDLLAAAPGLSLPVLLVSVAFLLVAVAVAVVRPAAGLQWAMLLLVAAAGSVLLWQAGAYAEHIARTESPLARTALGGGFWVALLLLGLMASDAVQRLQLDWAPRWGVWLVLLCPLLAVLVGGPCADLSLVKEYFNREDVFVAAVLRHLQIVALTVLFTLCLGLPLGWWAHRRAGLRQALFPVLNIIQTVPSIALFGLLMAPLALLAAAYPALARAGISGIGLAPGVIALTLYSLLPVVRGVVAGLEQVPRAATEAASAMGMTAWPLFRHIELPLALPVMLAGLRTATIQAVGLAAVTALIGAGGLGAIMFEGLFSSAQDVVLLGVVPIMALAVLADAGFKGLIRCVQTPQT